MSIEVQGPRRDSGSAEAKKVLDALENDTKANFQENIPAKIQFQKKRGEEHGAWLLWSPFVGGPEVFCY